MEDTSRSAHLRRTESFTDSDVHVVPRREGHDNGNVVVPRGVVQNG